MSRDAAEQKAIEICARIREHNRARHAREIETRVAAGLGMSREKLRKTRRVVEIYGEEADKFPGGVDRLYAIAKGDDRASLFVKIPAKLYAKLVDAAGEHDKKLQDVVVEALTQIFGE